MQITSKENDNVKFVCALSQSAKKRRESGLFVLEGLRLCTEVVNEDVPLEYFFYTADSFSKHAEVTRQLVNRAKKSFEVSGDVFKKMSDTQSPQGVLCVCKIPDPKNKVLNNGRYLAFENSNDPSNLGAAARTADALGINGIILSSESCDPYSPKVLRASMGAMLRLPIITADDFLDEMKLRKDSGMRLIGSVIDRGAKTVTEIEFFDGDIMLIGNEANGLTEQAKSLCDLLVTIPMRGRAESLNAAAAAAILMWEMQKL